MCTEGRRDRRRVSAGIDMALELAAKLFGDTVAQAGRLSIEYDPQPPFDSGSQSKATRRIVFGREGRTHGGRRRNSH